MTSAVLSRPVATLLLLITTAIWGFAFVAQKTAMDVMGPLTFGALRYLLGAIVIAPLALWEYRRRKAGITGKQWLLIAILSLAFTAGSILQQVGLTVTTVTNAGFLTALYVLFVPMIAAVALRTVPHPVIWLGVPMALTGVYLLNGGRLDTFNSGDLLVVACALFWAVQVFLLGIVARMTGLPVFVSAVSFLVCGVLCAGLVPIFETPDLSGIALGWVEIAYAGILSTAVAFSLQAIGQQHVPPANAAIVLSSESLFAALGAALLLGERLVPIGYLGAALIFAAIVFVEVIPLLFARQRPAAVAAEP
ncbi:DMT family transporter [Devosia geojensis]|uniref:DMT family transporter n=1 Tax=Devosia geojensis TaxID=443610 RepID=UPI00069650DD|nr:DMT family transporter [Devosia geojensis]